MADIQSILDLKVNELLKEVRVEYPPPEALETVLGAIRSCLQKIPDHEVDASLAPAFIEDLGVSVHHARFKFKAPEVVEVVGSFASRTIAKPVQNIDLAVQIPKSCFREKDFLNHRYHAKRVLYLAVLRKHIAKCPVVESTKWTLLHHDARKPILALRLGCEKEFSPAFGMHILPVIAQDVFDASKLTPSRNNVRITSSDVKEPTPHYNSGILEDVNIQDHSSFMKTVISQFNGLQDAVVLLKVWIRQRGFSDSADSLNSFLVSMLVAHLLVNLGNQKSISNLNAFQIFRICIEALASGAVLESGIFLHQSDASIGIGQHLFSKQMKQAHFQCFDTVMIDCSGLHNMSFRVTKDALKEIRDAAHCTISTMKSSRDCGFNEVYMTPIDFTSKFDYHIRICPPEGPSVDKSKSSLFSDEDNTRDFEKRVARILGRGLGDRVALIRVYPRCLPSTWTIEESACVSGNLPVYVGIMASNFEAAYRMVDVGPSADNKEEAATFRSFWGTKAELRRFKDGTINETAVWECASSQRHLIIQKIVEHLLSQHLSLPSCSVHVVAGQLDFAILEQKTDHLASIPKLLEAFDIFSKRLRNLEDLPLKISSVQPLHAAFRSAAVFLPQYNVLADERKGFSSSGDPSPSFAEPLEVMVQLEGSGRWPSHQIALEKTKAAFSLKIAESMHRVYGIKSIATERSIDLFMHGFCFRLKIYYEKDPTLVQKRQHKLNHVKSEAILHSAENVNLSTSLKDDLLLQGLHSSMMNGLQGRYPTYGPTVRLAKRWVAAHLFSDVLEDQAIDLVVAYLFVRPSPYNAPLSRITGLLRFLQLLVNFEWALAPLIVDLNKDLTVQEQNFIMDEFDNVRKSQLSNGVLRQGLKGGPAMYIATPYDLKSVTWTLRSPTCSMLRRLVAYARTSADLLRKIVAGEMPGRWLSLFRTPLNLYDILLKVDKKNLPHPFRVLFPADIKAVARVVVKSVNGDIWGCLPLASHHEAADGGKQLLVGFDPTQCLLEDLKLRFGDLFIYWYDSIGSDVIGLTQTALPNEMPLKKRKRAAEDFASLVMEMGEMAEGFLESIHY